MLLTYCAVFTPYLSTRRSPASHSLLPPVSLSRSLSLSSEMKQELAEEGSRCSILSKQHRFNEHCCIRCCAPFTFLFNPKRQCLDCQFNVCKTCCTYSKRDRAWLCSACQKGRLVFAHTHTHPPIHTHTHTVVTGGINRENTLEGSWDVFWAEDAEAEEKCLWEN